METKTLRRLQLLELEELKAVARFCDANDIRYFLDSGTLLGAVRHQGFIPWDDDVDICMDVRNYRRFLHLARLMPERYYVQNFRNDPTMGAIWTKVRVNGTTVTPKSLPITNTHCGACLDIFVIAGLARSGLGRWFQQQAWTLLRALMSKEEKLAAGQSFSRRIMLLQKLPYPARKGLALLFERVLLLDTQHSDRCFSVFNGPTNPDTVFFPPEAFRAERAVQLPFEGELFACPGTYETVLEAYYGDWRTPPPPAQRSGHGDLLVDFEHGVEYHLQSESG